MNNIQIRDLKSATDAQKKQAADVLYQSFRKNWPYAWPTLESAVEELNDCLSEGKIALAAIDRETDELVGWVGGTSMYDGNVWELHPLAVAETRRKEGVGRALMANLEQAVAQLGAHTIYLGSDDVSDQTTLSAVNLYEDTWTQIKEIRNIKDHPFSFYQKVGFTIVGIVPDANGPGKPDIMMAKSVRR